MNLKLIEYQIKTYLLQWTEFNSEICLRLTLTILNFQDVISLNYSIVKSNNAHRNKTLKRHEPLVPLAEFELVKKDLLLNTANLEMVKN